MTRIDTPVPPTPGPEAEADEIVAEPEVGYRWKHLIMAILMIAGGLWFAYDGWINWPRQNETATKLEKELERAQRETKRDETKIADLSAQLKKNEKHNDASILLQKLLAFALPAFGLFW